MSIGESSPPASHPQQVYGKDHINLADWPIGALTHQAPTEKDGRKTGVKVYTIERSDRTRQTVRIEGGARTGLPVPADDDVLIALITLGAMNEFETDTVSFTAYPFLRLMRWPQNSHYAMRLKASLERLTKLHVTYEGIWYDRQTGQVESTKFTGVIADAKITFRKGRRSKDSAPDCYVQWTKTFHESLKHGNLITINLDLLFSWKRPCAKHLHRHLNKVWHSGRKPKPYERDLHEIACGHLGMADNKDLKRNFDLVYEELVDRQYLAGIPKEERYKKIRPRVWRVRFELDPTQYQAKKKSEAGESSKNSTATSKQSNAVTLVQKYHRCRFNRANYEPRNREIEHAKKLLGQYEEQTLFDVLSDVARRVGESSQEDLYFGFAVPIFHATIEERKQKEQINEREQQRAAIQGSLEKEIATEKHRRSNCRRMLVKQWNSLPDETRLQYHRAAIDKATSQFDRRRIRTSTIQKPSIEALELMASDLACATRN